MDGRTRMKRAKDLLDPETRRAILADERPTLTWPGEQSCPVERGDEIGFIWLRSLAGLVAQFSIKITAIRRGKKGEHLADYSVRDDRPLYLRHNSGSTRSATESLDPEASITDEKALRAYAAQGRLAAAQRREDNAESKARQARAARSELTEIMSGLEGDARIAWLSEFKRLCQKTKMRRAG